MTKKQDKLIKIAIKLLFCELFSCVFMTAVSNSLDVSITTAAIVFSTFITTIIFYIFSYFKKSFKIFSIFIFSLLALSVVVFLILVIVGVLPNFADLFQMLIDRALSTEKLTEGQQFGFVYGVIIFISFLAVYFIADKINLVALSASTFVFYAVQFASTKNRASMGAFVVLVYILVVLALYKVFEYFENKSGTSFGYKRFAVFGIAGVMCILIALASVIAPFEENSFSKKFSLERYSNDIFFENGVGSYYIAWSGVGYDDANLGGARGALNFDKALKITSKKPTYIVASYSNSYNGRAFELSNSYVASKKRYHEKGEDAYDASNIPMNTLLKTASFDKAGLSYAKNPITLTYQGKMDFRTIFTTNGLTFIENPHKRTLWYDACDNLYTNQYMKNKFDYSFDSYYFNINDELKYLASDAYTGENPDNSVINQLKFEQFERNIYNTYLSLPSTVPTRVKELSEQIIAHEEARTRLEKVNALMGYLYGFEYVYQTNSIPAGSDFVDYFLFTEKKGYSTYFAAALAVMCREVGIPSRYVKGFAPLSKAGEDQFICNNNAHAWVEVYFDGYGWVTFEPSPYFAEKFYDISMNDYREDKTIFNEDGEQVPEPEQEEETKEETEEKAEQNETENKVITPEEKKAIATRKYIIAAVIVVCSATFVYLIGYSLVRRRKRQIKRFYRYDGRQFVYAAWYEIRRISKFDGQKIKADETPYTFLKRLGDEYGEDVLPLAADSFNKLLYSKKALITREDRAYAEAAYKALDKHISTRHKKWYFNLCRYILHII